MAAEKKCMDCKFYTPKEGNPGKGDCFGHEVNENETCEQFQPKES